MGRLHWLQRIPSPRPADSPLWERPGNATIRLPTKEDGLCALRPILANGLPSGMFRFNRTIQNQQQPGIPEETTKGSSGYASRGMIRLENALWSATLFRMGRSGLIGRSAGPIPATQGKCDIVRPSPIVACWPETHPSRLFANPEVREHPGCGGTRSGWFLGSPRRLPGRIPERWFPHAKASQFGPVARR